MGGTEKRIPHYQNRFKENKQGNTPSSREKGQTNAGEEARQEKNGGEGNKKKGKG